MNIHTYCDEMWLRWIDRRNEITCLKFFSFSFNFVISILFHFLVAEWINQSISIFFFSVCYFFGGIYTFFQYLQFSNAKELNNANHD